MPKFYDFRVTFNDGSTAQVESWGYSRTDAQYDLWRRYTCITKVMPI